MDEEFKFRVLTGEDWGKGTRDGLKVVDGGLELEGRDGSYTSEPLDSGIVVCRWHRIVLDADIPDNSTLTVSFYSSDSEKEEDAKSWSGTVVFTADTRDALVEAPPGRYIGLKIDFHREGTERLLLKQVKIYYPRLSYLRYLPAVYQEERTSREFLERFLSIFESVLHDSEETIYRIPAYLDPMAAPEDFYPWLASWLSLDLYELLGDRNREFILRAAKFYKRKGTVSGIADLVSLLTGKRCCVKEYMNNVFRSYGMEHRGEEETDDEMRERLRKCRRKTERVEDIECTKFYRKTSKTVDTTNSDLRASMGRYCDEVHYVTDTAKDGRCHPQVIGLFIFLPPGEKLLVDKDELLKIINSFLPVFVRAKIDIVELPCDEKYYLSTIIEERKDHIHGFSEERITALQGVYIDRVDWDWLYTYSAKHPKGTTNNVDYRTPHSEIGVEILIDN
jgi:phage tail-like protein